MLKKTFLLFKHFNHQPSLCSWSFFHLVDPFGCYWPISYTSNSINSHIWLCEMEFILSTIVISHMLFIIVLEKNDRFPNMVNYSHNELVKMPRHHFCSSWLFLWHISMGLLCRILFFLQFITWPFWRRVMFWKDSLSRFNDLSMKIPHLGEFPIDAWDTFGKLLGIWGHVKTHLKFLVPMMKQLPMMFCESLVQYMSCQMLHHD